MNRNDFGTWLMIAVLVVASGCGTKLTTSYGPSKGFTARRSVNGFSALRDAFAKKGYRHRDVHRLTDRVRSASVIVWTPTHPAGIEFRTTNWFESWLASGDKSLVYVIPDSGSESEFYREARQYATPSQRLEYRRRYAENLVAEHRWQLNRTTILNNGWLTVRPKVQSSSLVMSSGASDVWKQPPETNDSYGPRRLEWTLEAYDADDKSHAGSMVWKQVGPAQTNWPMGGGGMSPTATPIDFQPVLETESGDVVLAELTSKRWKNSRILVVAGGSLLTNFGLTRPSNQKLADQLISATYDPLVQRGVVDKEMGLLKDGLEPQAGFATASGRFSVSERVDDIPRASGAKFFQFPLSLITIHFAVLGIVVCLMLMPIFGRPRPTREEALTHFGDHLDAVAILMRRSGGETFARRKISDYMKRLRGETSGKWVMPEPKPKPSAVPGTSTADSPTEEETPRDETFAAQATEPSTGESTNEANSNESRPQVD